MLPNLFVIGAPKCGTTSLHSYLDLHPQIAMTTEKEPQLFAGADFPQSLRSYAGLLDADARVRGESSVVYSQHPNWAGIAERIAERVPEARFIYLVRDPIERAVAHYRQHVRAGKESRTIEQALSDYERPDSAYLTPSRYATQLGRYLRHFDRSRFLVLDQAELASRREAALERTFRFLGVDPDFRSPDFAAELNTRQHLHRVTPLGAVLPAGSMARLARRARVPAGLRRRLGPAFSRPIKEPELPGPLRRRLAESLAAEVAWLREFTGARFEYWSV